MDITFTTARRAPANAAVVAHGLTTEGLESPPDGLDPNALRRLGFTAESGQVQVVPAGERLVAAVGLGAADGVDLGTLRKAGAALARAVRRHRSGDGVGPRCPGGQPGRSRGYDPGPVSVRLQIGGHPAQG